MPYRFRLGGVNLRKTLKGTSAFVAATVLLGGVQAPSTTDRTVTVRAVRSYRGESRTQVDAFLQVPYRWIASTKDSAGGLLSYQLSVRVTDSTGLTLMKESWQNHADGSLGGTDAFGVEVI